MKPTKLAFETQYSDGSGVQYAVRFDSNRIESEIELESVNEITFPLDRLPWLIAALQRIEAEIGASPHVDEHQK